MYRRCAATTTGLACDERAEDRRVVRGCAPASVARSDRIRSPAQLLRRASGSAWLAPHRRNTARAATWATWPDGPRPANLWQIHLDLAVEDLDPRSAAMAAELGSAVEEDQTINHDGLARDLPAARRTPVLPVAAHPHALASARQPCPPLCTDRRPPGQQRRITSTGARRGVLVRRRRERPPRHRTRPPVLPRAGRRHRSLRPRAPLPPPARRSAAPRPTRPAPAAVSAGPRRYARRDRLPRRCRRGARAAGTGHWVRSRGTCYPIPASCIRLRTPRDEPRPAARRVTAVTPSCAIRRAARNRVRETTSGRCR